MPRNKKNLTILMNQKIDSLLKIGEKKHIAKQIEKARCAVEGVRWNPSKVPGIHSICTAENYRQVACEFGQWLKNKGLKHYSLDSVEKSTAIAYLQERMDQNKSAWTLHKDQAALNKIFDFGITSSESEIPKRSYTNIIRSREACDHDFRNFKGFEPQMMLAQACGMRRQSMLQVKPEDFQYTDKGFGVWLKEKGGRERIALIRTDKKEAVMQLLEGKELGKPLFSEYDIHIDNHAFRAEYAKNLYKQLESEGKGSGENYKGFDKAIVQEVSLNLGHNRLDVSVNHYLRGFK